MIRCLNRHLPLPFSLSLTSILSPFLTFPAPPLPYKYDPLNLAKGAGERCKLRQRGAEWSPAENSFGAL